MTAAPWRPRAGLPESAAAGRSGGVKGLPAGGALPARPLDAENGLLGSRTRQARPCPLPLCFLYPLLLHPPLFPFFPLVPPSLCRLNELAPFTVPSTDSRAHRQPPDHFVHGGAAPMASRRRRRAEGHAPTCERRELLTKRVEMLRIEAHVRRRVIVPDLATRLPRGDRHHHHEQHEDPKGWSGYPFNPRTFDVGNGISAGVPNRSRARRSASVLSLDLLFGGAVGNRHPLTNADRLQSFTTLNVIGENAADLSYEELLILRIPKRARRNLGRSDAEIGPGELRALSYGCARVDTRITHYLSGARALFEELALLDHPAIAVDRRLPRLKLALDAALEALDRHRVPSRLLENHLIPHLRLGERL